MNEERLREIEQAAHGADVCGETWEVACQLTASDRLPRLKDQYGNTLAVFEPAITPGGTFLGNRRAEFVQAVNPTSVLELIAALRTSQERERKAREALKNAQDTFADFEHTLSLLQRPVLAEAARIAKEAMADALSTLAEQDDATK